MWLVLHPSVPLLRCCLLAATYLDTLFHPVLPLSWVLIVLASFPITLFVFSESIKISYLLYLLQCLSFPIKYELHQFFKKKTFISLLYHKYLEQGLGYEWMITWKSEVGISHRKCPVCSKFLINIHSFLPHLPIYFQQAFYILYVIDELLFTYIVSFGCKIHNSVLI